VLQLLLRLQKIVLLPENLKKKTKMAILRKVCNRMRRMARMTTRRTSRRTSKRISKRIIWNRTSHPKQLDEEEAEDGEELPVPVAELGGEQKLPPPLPLSVPNKND